MIQLELPGTDVADNALMLPVYYDPAELRYYIPNDHGEYMSVTRATAEAFLVSFGVEPLRAKGESQSELERAMLRVQLKNCVHYVGPLAGYNVGLQRIGTTRALITRATHPVAPVPGDWPTLEKLLRNLFGSKQLDYVYGWIKQTLDMLRSHRQRPGQAFVVCGPHGAGKSLLRSVLTVLFGGEPGHPWKAMNDKTQFNSDLFASVLLVVDDEAESTDIRTRRAFGANIRKIVALRDQPCHKKHAEQISLRPLWRLMILLNDDQERLHVLPPLDGEIDTKMMLFKVEALPMPMPTDTPDEDEAFMNALTSELPAFVHFLDQWTVPTKLACPRFGITHWHHEEVIRDLQALSPEEQLRQMIDEVIFGPIKAALRPQPWEGKAVELERTLMDKESGCTREAERLLPPGGMVCGKYLGRLEKLHPGRFSHRIVFGLRHWTVQPPACCTQAATSTGDFNLLAEMEARFGAVSKPAVKAADV